MPLCYGGGIKTVEQASSIIGMGVEKVAISSAAIDNPRFISEVASEVGGQSVAVVIDVKRRKDRKGYDVWTHNGTRDTGKGFDDVIVEAERLGAGEIVVNSIDNDGMMKGYDLELAGRARALAHVPITVLGGAGSLADLGALISACGVVGAAAGSLFVFKGAYRAVLINYPDEAQKEALVRGALSQ